MGGSSETLHEKESDLGPEAIDLHRALVSVQEELEAVDWYNQRAAATGDPELRDLLVHNRDEEKEHAVMMIEWLRRRDPKFHEMLSRYLFTEAPIMAVEQAVEHGASAAGDGGDGSLGIGSLKQGKRR